MGKKTKIFPVYRKYPNDKVFFMVISAFEFQRLDIVGDGYSLHTFKSNNYADRLFINDVIENESNKWAMSNKEEFEGKLQYCKKFLKDIDKH
jgi:hypothetical protein